MISRYPVAYSIVVLPLSVVRWITFGEQGCGRSSVPAAATFAAVFLHGCFGFVNVVLLLTTRQTLLLFDDPRNPRQVRLRRAAGGVLADWDDEEARGSGDHRLARKKSQESRRAASLDSTRSALGVTFELQRRDLSVNALPPTPSSSAGKLRFEGNATGAGGDGSERRTQPNRGNVENELSGVNPQQRHRGTLKQHSKSDSAGPLLAVRDGFSTADEYSDEEIARRFALVTSSN